MMKFRMILMLGIMGVAFGRAAAADDVLSTIHLDDGTTVGGKIIKEHTDMIIIESEGKNKSIDKDKIVRITRDDNYAPTLTQGYELESAGKYGEAIEKYQAILRKDPLHKDAAAGWERMMQAIPYEFKTKYLNFYQSANYDRLLQFIYTELSGVPADSPRRDAMKTVESEIYTFMGQDKMKRLLYQQAEADFRRALRLDPKNHTASLMLGDLLTATSRWEEAYLTLIEVMDTFSDNLIAAGLLMQAAFHTNRYEQGLQLYEAMKNREGLSPQELKFIALCETDCRNKIAEALKLRAESVQADGDTSGAEKLRMRSEAILNRE